MTLGRLKKRLEKIGVPVAYHHFKRATEPPFMVYYSPSSESISGDYVNFGEKITVYIDLCTQLKDLGMERKVQQAISDFDYIKRQAYLEDEAVYQTTYEIQIIEKGNENGK